MDLLVISFFYKCGIFSLNLLRADLVLIEKVRMVASFLAVYCILGEIFG